MGWKCAWHGGQCSWTAVNKILKAERQLRVQAYRTLWFMARTLDFIPNEMGSHWREVGALFFLVNVRCVIGS